MKREREPACREDVLSSETWKGGTGTITFNYLQQREEDTSERPETPLEEAGTTDIWDATDG